MNQWLISMTAGPWQVAGIQKAKEAGYKVLGIDGKENSFGFSFCDQSLVVDITNKTALLDALKATGITPLGIFSFCSEVGMLPASWIREEYNLHGLLPSETEKVLFKHIQRKIWKDAGVENIKWFLSENIEEANSQVNSVGFPCIIKPVDSSGSRGVSKVLNFDEFKEAYRLAAAASRLNLVLVEEYLDGVEYTVEAFTENSFTKILVVTEKAKVEGSRGTVASELSYPSISDEQIEKIKSKVLSAIHALDYKNGPTHTELILTKNGRIGLVEMAGRGGGFGVFSKLIPLASGIDATDFLIKQSANKPIQLANSTILKNKFSLKFFPVVKKGKITSIDGIDEANKLGDVEVGSYVKVGDMVDDSFCDGNRMGFMLIKGSELSAIQIKINKIESLVKFKVECV